MCKADEGEGGTGVPFLKILFCYGLNPAISTDVFVFHKLVRVSTLSGYFTSDRES